MSSIAQQIFNAANAFEQDIASQRKTIKYLMDCLGSYEQRFEEQNKQITELNNRITLQENEIKKLRETVVAKEYRTTSTQLTEYVPPKQDTFVQNTEQTEQIKQLTHPVQQQTQQPVKRVPVPSPYEEPKDEPVVQQTKQQPQQNQGKKNKQNKQQNQQGKGKQFKPRYNQQKFDDTPYVPGNQTNGEQQVQPPKQQPPKQQTQLFDNTLITHHTEPASTSSKPLKFSLSEAMKLFNEYQK